MARKRKVNTPRIVCRYGETTLDCPGLVAAYQPTKWIIKLNSKFKPPGLRKEQVRILWVNGRRMGKAFHTEACLPVPWLMDEGSGFRVFLINLIKIKLGWMCSRNDRGYFFVKVNGFKYAVLSRITKERHIYATVYRYLTGEVVGTLGFNPEFTKAYIQTRGEGLPNTLKVILGYLADCNVYNVVVEDLNRVVDIVSPE